MALCDRFIIDGTGNEGIGSSAGSATNASVPSAGKWRAAGELANADQLFAMTRGKGDRADIAGPISVV